MDEIERRELLRWAGIHIRSAFQGGYERTTQHVNDALHNIALVLADLNGENDNDTETAVDRLTRELGEVQDELISARTAAKIENNLRLDAVAELAVARECLAFFRSVIQSGESWTETCEEKFKAAREGE